MQARRAALAAALIAIVVQLPSLGGGFVHDDKPQIAFNPLVNGLGSLPALWQTGVWVGAGSGSSYYRPLMMTSFAADAAIFGRTPLPMHAVQIVLFALLVAAAVRTVASVDGDVVVGLGAGLVLAAHPVNVEPVAWISARCDLLAALFCLLCLELREQRLRGIPAAGDRLLLRLGEAVALFLALASKESAVAVLPALVALDHVRHAPMAARALVERWSGIGLAVLAYAGLRAHALGSLSGGLLGRSDPWAVVGAFGQGALRLVLPLGLSITPPAPTALETGIGAVLVVAGGTLLLRLWLRQTPALVAATLGLAFLAVAASGAARLGEMADRYLLVPSIAAGWLATRGIRNLAPRTEALGLRLGAAALALLAVLSFLHAPVYASDEVLWSQAYAHNPASSRAAINEATALIDAGKVAEAEPWLERAAALDPSDRLVRINRAVVAAERGDVRSARELLLALAADHPDDWQAQLRLGHLALDASDPDEAATRYDLALRLNPLSPEAWAGLGVARARQGRRADAHAALQRALALDPTVQNADALRSLLDATRGDEGP